MSLEDLIPSHALDSFPRVSGDEPALAPLIPVIIRFSPRERG